MPTCPHCGFESGAGGGSCPLCGSRLGEAGGAPAGTVAAPAWEDPRAAFPGNLIGTWRDSLLRPTAFFRRVRPAGALSRPLLYYLIATVVGAFFTMWWEAVGLWPGTWRPETAGWAAEPGGAAALVGFFLTPFAALLALAVWTVVLHLFVVLLVPDRRPLRATARVLCYTAGPSVFTAVPLLGPLVGAVWATVLQVIGIREIHRTTTGRAAAAVLLPLAALLLLLAIVVAMALVAGLALIEQYA